MLGVLGRLGALLVLGALCLLGALRVVGALCRLGALRAAGALDRLGAERALGVRCRLGALRADGVLGRLGALRADGALGLLGALLAEGVLGRLGALRADGALGRLGALRVEGVLGVRCPLGALRADGVSGRPADGLDCRLGVAPELGCRSASLGDTRPLGLLPAEGALGVPRVLGLLPADGALRVPPGRAAGVPFVPLTWSDGRAAGLVAGAVLRVVDGRADGVPVRAPSDGRADGAPPARAPPDGRAVGEADLAVEGRVAGDADGVLADGGVRFIAGRGLAWAVPRLVAVGRVAAATGVAEGAPAPDRRVAVLTPELPGFSLYLGLYGESGDGLWMVRPTRPLAYTVRTRPL